MRLRDQVAIITGGARGIGAAFVKAFVGEGANVVIADVRYEVATALASEVDGTGKRAIAIYTDVTNSNSTEEMAKLTVQQFGRIDVLINNAAIFIDIPLKNWDEISEDEWDQVMAVNLKGMFLCCKAVLPYMKQQGKGKIINISSSTAYFGGYKRLHYVTSKAGVIGFTRALAREVGVFGVTVNAISPGSVITEEVRRAYSDEIIAKMAAGRCINRLEKPEDLVGTAIFLASSDSDFITGQSIVVDGGIVMH